MSDFLGDTIDLLRRTPGVLQALLGGIDDSWVETPDVEGGWRPRDVVGHLISGERTNYLQRVERILEHGTSKAFDPFDRFEMLERDKGRSLDELLADFARERAANLDTLRALTAGVDLDTRGLHPATGEVTLRQLLATWSVHDLDHVAQVYAGMAGSRDAAVGSWKQYLGILLRREDPSAVPG